MAEVEATLAAGGFEAHVLDESLLGELHRRICGDLVPGWAGRWRDIEVRVGSLEPPPTYQIPVLMHEYGLDLQARWQAAAGEMSDLTLEFLAYAEGRFLTIHPFRDFNGRTIRLFLAELMRRLDLPGVVLAPEGGPERAAYFAALEAADRFDWRPLTEIWRARFGV